MRSAFKSSQPLAAAIIVVLAAGLACDRAHAEAPTLDALYPAGGQAGQTVKVTLVGKSEPWPASVWCSHAGLKITTDKEKKAELAIAIPADARPGPVLIRLFNAEGASEPRTFIIGPKHVAERNEVEPNTNLHAPKPLAEESGKAPPLPLTINGRLSESADVDLFPLALKKGQTLSAAADCYALGSPIDPHLVLYGPGPDRDIMALGNDGPGTLDPRLEYKVERDGDYLLGVMGFIHPPNSKISFHNSAAAVYRLTLTTGPWLRFPDPAAVASDKPTKLKLHGGAKPVELSLPPADAKAEPSFVAAAPIPRRHLSHPHFANTLPVPAVSYPLQAAEKMTVPAAVSGTLAKPGDTAEVRFSAKKSDKIEFKLRAHHLSSDLDPVLIVENAEGKELKRVDDTKPTMDAELLWTSPADGDYVVRVADVTGAGGENHRYLLTAAPAEPAFSATIATSKHAIKPGDSAEVTVKLTRSNDHALPLEAKVENLPAGITAEVAELPAKTGDFKITLKADANAKPANQPLRIVVEQKAAEGVAADSCPVLFTFVGSDWRGPYLVEDTEAIWLTVLAKPEEKKAEEKKDGDEAKKE